MAETNQVFRPETITDQPLPTQAEIVAQGDYGSASSGAGKTVFTPQQTVDEKFPPRFIPPQVMGDSFDTQARKIKGNFTFTSLGAITIGQYDPGVSGEIKISPNGIIAKNDQGVETFTLDGTTGNATFKGTIQAGTFIAGATQVGGNFVVIDGANGRIIGSDGVNNRFVLGNVS